MSTRIVTSGLALIGLAGSAAAQSASQKLTAEITRIEPSSGGTVGVAAQHIESGRTFFYKADEQFPLASTYKVPMAILGMKLDQERKLDLNEMIQWDTTDLHIGSEAHLLFRKPGFATSLRNIVENTIILSENNSTDILLAKIGGGAAVTQYLRSLGINDMRIDRPTAEVIAHPYGITDIWTADGKFSRTKWEKQVAAVSQARRDSIAWYYAKDPRDHASPRAMLTLLTKLWKGELLDKAHTDELLDIMYRTETGRGRLKGMLPEGTRVAHKTGTYAGTANDVGIIDMPDGSHLAIAIYVKGSRRIQGPPLENAIAQSARAVYDYFLYSSK